MLAQVLSERGKALLRRSGKISLAGDGLLERMRSTAFALLGITAALALGLVALAAQQGWPDLPFSPLPGPTAKQGEVHGALVAAPPGDAGVGSAQPPARAPTAAAAAPTNGGGTDKGGLSGSHQLEVPVADEGPAADAPSGQDAAPPSSQVEAPPGAPPAAAPAPTPESSPAPAAPAVSPPSKPEPVAVSATKDLDQDKDKARAYGKDKSSSGKGGKSEKDEKSSESKASPPPPAPSVVESDDYADEKEVEEDKDDSPTYRGKDRSKAYEHKGK
jgi:hypothetical protein